MQTVGAMPSSPVIDRKKVHSMQNGIRNYHTHTWRCQHARGTEEEYVKDITFPIFSANILGEWFEKAEMGWWALTSNDKDPAVWKDMLESALRKAQEENPDEEFHVLDCHI
jgi:hypothetical protein